MDWILLAQNAEKCVEHDIKFSVFMKSAEKSALADELLLP